VPLQPDDVHSRLGYARLRIDDLLTLNRGDLIGADGHHRQRLTQEVFFHLVGAIEVFAQMVNERRNLSRASEKVSISKLARGSVRSIPAIRSSLTSRACTRTLVTPLPPPTRTAAMA
jgi:hypothetical protein